MSPTLDAALKTTHVLSAVLFVGNVVVTGVWSALFFRLRETHDFRAAARAIVVTDWVFTFGGGTLLTASGIALAMSRGLPIWGTPWIRQALLALVVATVLWLGLLVPAQRTMLRATPAIEAEWTRAFRRWTVVGWIATVPLLYAIWCMVAKPSV